MKFFVLSVLEKIFIGGKSTGDNFPPGVYKISDPNLMLKSSISSEVKVKNTIDDGGLKSNITIKKTIITKKKRFIPDHLGLFPITLGSFG